MYTLEELECMSDRQLARVDPVDMNLLVAKGTPPAADLHIPRYRHLADRWADYVRKRLRAHEQFYHRDPWEWDNDIRLFRLGELCRYIDKELGVRPREDYREFLKKVISPEDSSGIIPPWAITWEPVRYDDPAVLFLHGIMDTRQGTCGNMSSLHLALAWRLGWPLSLACSWSHLLARYDDGQMHYNIEATTTGRGGFNAPPDEYYIKEDGIPPAAIRCGSDLTPLRPRQLLGVFIGLRGRYYQDSGSRPKARLDYLRARRLFPESRYLYFKSEQVNDGPGGRPWLFR
jgi:hypothetical protein